MLLVRNVGNSGLGLTRNAGFALGVDRVHVALAGEEHNVAGRGGLKCKANGRGAVRLCL